MQDRDAEVQGFEDSVAGVLADAFQKLFTIQTTARAA